MGPFEPTVGGTLGGTTLSYAAGDALSVIGSVPTFPVPGCFTVRLQSTATSAHGRDGSPYSSGSEDFALSNELIRQPGWIVKMVPGTGIPNLLIGRSSDRSMRRSAVLHKNFYHHVEESIRPFFVIDIVIYPMR